MGKFALRGLAQSMARELPPRASMSHTRWPVHDNWRHSERRQDRIGGPFCSQDSFEQRRRPRSPFYGFWGTAAIYNKKGKPVHIISKVTLRMKKWLLYVVPSVQKS
jgi:hypothetical protein